MKNIEKIELHFDNIIQKYSNINQEKAVEFIKIYRGLFSDLIKTNAFIGKEKDLFKIINDSMSKLNNVPSSKRNGLNFQDAQKIIDEIFDINLNENNN